MKKQRKGGRRREKRKGSEWRLFEGVVKQRKGGRTREKGKGRTKKGERSEWVLLRK